MLIQMKCFPSVGNSARLMCWTSVIWAHHVRTFNLSLSLQWGRELGLLPWGRGSAGESQHTSEYLKGGHREDGDRLCSVVAHTGPEEQALDTIWSPRGSFWTHCCAVRMTESRHRDPEAVGFHRDLGTWPDMGLSTALDFPPWAGFGPMDTEAPYHLHHSVIL